MPASISPCTNCGKRHRTLTAEMCSDRSMSEAVLQQRVRYRAKKWGWRAAHAGRAEVHGRWITPMAEGWPDLTLVKAGHSIIFMELKKELGIVEDAQAEWLLLLTATGNYGIVVRPSDLRAGRVDTILRNGAPVG